MKELPSCAHQDDDGVACGHTREWDGHNPAHESYSHSLIENWPPTFRDMFGAFPFMGRKSAGSPAIGEQSNVGTKEERNG